MDEYRSFSLVLLIGFVDRGAIESIMNEGILINRNENDGND